MNSGTEVNTIDEIPIEGIVDIRLSVSLLSSSCLEYRERPSELPRPANTIIT